MSREFILFGGKISRKRKKCQVTSPNLMDVDIRWSRFSCLHALEEKGTLARGNISCWDISLTMWLYIYWQFSSNCKRNAPGEVICIHEEVSFHFFGTLRFWRFCYLTLASSSTDAEKLYSTRPRKAEQDAEIRRERGEYRYRESYRELETLKQINDDK